MAQWVKPEFSKREIDRAGELLIPWWDRGAVAPEQLGRFWMIIQNWRSSHAFPLNTFQMGLRQRARKIEDGVIVAQRLKRLSAVMNKLCREPNMKLSQMQDLGGCRAILSNVERVNALFDVYTGGPALFETEGSLKFYDYIRKPKLDGYRGIHIVGRYCPKVETRELWRGARVEIQLRSRLQHAFATTVETVTTFTRYPLKFGGGPPQWRRFFSLVGSAFAIREGTPTVPGTPESTEELIKELVDAVRALRVRQRLGGWTNALRSLPKINTARFRWLLLLLNIPESSIRVRGYWDRQQAIEAVAKIEREKNPNIDAVLVHVGSVTDLKAAYPNYYADTRNFLNALNLALKGTWLASEGL